MHQQLLGLDIGTSTAKFVLMSLKGRDQNHPFQILANDIVQLPPTTTVDGEIVNPNLLATALKSTLRKNGIKTRQTAVAVKGPSMVLRRIDLPPLPVTQLKQLLNWEIERYIPYPAEEAEFNFVSLGQTAERHTILLGTSPKRIVQSFIETFERAGLKPRLLEPGILALFRWVQYCNPDQSDDSIIMELATNSINLLIIARGQPVMARTIALEAEQIQAKMYLIKELQRSLEFARSQNYIGPKPLCFCAGDNANSNMLSFISDHLDIWPIKMENYPFKKIDTNLFAVCLGLGLGWWGGKLLWDQ